MNKLKEIFLSTFGVGKPFRKGFKTALGDTFAILIGALVAGIITLITIDNPEYQGFVAYLAAALLLVVGLLVSRKNPKSKASALFTTTISSFLCVVASVDVLKLLCGAVLRISYWDTPLNNVPSFILNNSQTIGWEKTLLWLILGAFSVMMLHRWYDEHRAAKI